jgi:hypothetical protein
MNAHAEIAIAQLDLITQQTMVDAGLIVAVDIATAIAIGNAYLHCRWQVSINLSSSRLQASALILQHRIHAHSG